MGIENGTRIVGGSRPRSLHTMNGLSEEEALQSRRKHGANQLTERKRNGFFRQFLSSFSDPIIRILLAALAINALLLFHGGNVFEFAGIAAAVFISTFVSTLSEYGSELAFKKLQKESANSLCRVRRGGIVRNMPLNEIVVGDIILLDAGDRIPADGVLMDGKLTVDQSALNGESQDAVKQPSSDVSEKHDLSGINKLFRGSTVTSGTGVMRVMEVGDTTLYGGMANEMQGESRESPLKVRLSALASAISKIGYIAAALVAVSDLFNILVINNGIYTLSVPALLSHIMHALTLGITVVVVAVPEGLPMMITVVLSSNMFRMLKDNVMVRKLVGIETAGSLNILFTDKTGTLTKGTPEMMNLTDGAGVVYSSVSAMKAPVRDLVELSCYYNTGSMISDGRPIGGNATDRAVLEFVMPLMGKYRSYTKISSVPFDSSYKFSSATLQSTTGNSLILLKGAPELILPFCTKYYNAEGAVKPLSDKRAVHQRWREMTANAVRVIAMAVSDHPIAPAGNFSELTLIGLAGIRDELRSEAKKAVGDITRAGIQVVMVTGDNRDTAAAIARECGLIQREDGNNVLTSQELNAMTDYELKQALPSLRVIARALPSDKSRLIRVSQEAGLVAGMTGDGINDAPALKKADVGFAMGSGTEVAKEAGDIVILDNNIASIVRAILYGRTIFKSIRKFIIFQLTINMCAVGVSVIGSFIGIDTPVTVIQMLWINIIMDTLAGLAFAGEPPLEEYLLEPPKKRDEHVLNRTMVFQILWMGLYAIVLCVIFLKLDFFYCKFRYSSDDLYFMTGFFGLFIFTGVMNCFNARTHRLNLFAHLLKNPMFMIIMTVVAEVQLFLIYKGGSLFRTGGLTNDEMLLVILLSLTVIPVDLIRKALMRLHGKHGAL